MTNPVFLTDPTHPLAQALLTEPNVAFDIETDARPWHWKKSHNRGLSYCADMTEIAFHAGPHLPTLVLSAVAVPAQYVFETVERQGKIAAFSDRAVEMEAFRFTPSQLKFIKAMFTREDPVTFIAHNLVFDARQVFGKFELPIRDNFTLWDTRSIQLLHSGWKPEGWDDEEEEGDYDEDNEDEGLTGKEDKNDLLAVYERMVGQLDDGYHAFLVFMKGERPNFPVINFEKFFSRPEVIEYAQRSGLLYGANTEPMIRYLVYQYAEKKYYPTKTSVDPDVYHQALNLLAAETEYEIDDPKDMTKNQLRKLWKAAQAEMEADLQLTSQALMEHYITFDVIAAYEIFKVQENPPDGYKEYPRLLQEDLDYIKWCCETAARGVLVDRNYIKEKLQQIYDNYYTELLAMGFQLEDWDRVRKTDFAVQYIFWNNEIDGLYKGEKNYAKNVKANIAALEKTGQKPHTEPPPKEIIKAFQFDILTARGLKAQMNGWKITYEHFSFGKDACKIWVENIYPEKQEVKHLAKIKTYQGAITFLEMLLRETECDGRAHSLLGRFTITGRNTSSSPNLQNIHFEEKDLTLDMSGILIADPGYQFAEKDYSNAENFTATMYSGDPGMALACASADFHSMRAQMFFPEEWSAADDKGRKVLRTNSKRYTFGTSYGMGKEKLALTLGISEDEAQVNFINKDKVLYPYLAAAKDKVKKYADKKGFIPTWSGRRLRIAKRFHNKKKIWEYVGYTGWNSINQGGVADIVVFAMNKVNRHLRQNGYKTYIANQVHDSLIVAVHLDEYPHVEQEIIEIMSTVLDGEVREGWSNKDAIVYWNESTSPPVRWLTELDNLGNSKKWGRVHNQQYPFPLDEYVNRWGVHTMTEEEFKAGKAPTWINQWGYGEAALAREMGVESFEELKPAMPSVGQKPAPTQLQLESDFNWGQLQLALRDAVSITTPMTYNERVFEFPEAMAVRHQLTQRGHNTGLNEILGKLDKLAQVIEGYKEWKTSKAPTQ